MDHVIIIGMRANTCIDTTARYAVELGYHTTLIKDTIAAYTWEEIKTTIEINFPNYGHAYYYLRKNSLTIVLRFFILLLTYIY